MIPKRNGGGLYGLFDWHFYVGRREEGEGYMAWFILAASVGRDMMRQRSCYVRLHVCGFDLGLSWDWPEFHYTRIPRPE